MIKVEMNNQKLVLVFLKLSLASVFLYAAAAATLQPYNWIGYIPEILRQKFNGQILLTLFSLYQLILSLWILSGKKLFYSALLSSLTLLIIIIANFSQIDILFRDFAIFFAALALTAISYQKRN